MLSGEGTGREGPGAQWGKIRGGSASQAGMALRPVDGTNGHKHRRTLLAAGVVLAVLSLFVYLHAVVDGDPGVAESLRPGAAAHDPWAVGWFPVLASLFLVTGAVTRLRVAWVGIALLAVFGAYFFEGIGSLYLLAAALLAALASRIPPRAAAPRQERG